ncbi:SNF2 family protein [gut metagenome]|uniref:SNF2 family protein n=1 Tax=gut metagenome TaxID=749906 RepID=J9C3C1_9ZZZZ
MARLGLDDDDDDKKNSYYNLPENVRRSNILFKMDDYWISIPLSVEYRAVYGLGELMMSTICGKEHLSDGELAMQVAAQMSQVMPLDLMNDGGLMGLIPSMVKPWAEVHENKSWTGLPIYKDTPYNKDMPEWTKAYSNANKYIVGLSAAMNEVSGGDKYTKGNLDFNPSKVEHLLNGYFGGVFNTIDRMTKMAETAAGAREFDPQNFLILNRVVKAGDERTEHRAVNNEYFRLQKELETVGRRLRNYNHDTKNGIFDYAEKIDYLNNSPEYAKYEIYRHYRKYINQLQDVMKNVADEQERGALEEELFKIKKEMIDEINGYSK